MSVDLASARQHIHCRPGGFTLLEMMITVLVVGLLLFIALPGYQQTLHKSHRAAGRGALLDILARQEQYFINYKRYAQDMSSLGLPERYYIDAQSREVPAARAIYEITLHFEQDRFIGAQAAPRNSQGNDHSCLTLSLSLLGDRAASGSLAATPHLCWR